MSSDIAVKVEDLGKKYIIGKAGKQLSILEFFENFKQNVTRKKNEDFWALKDVSFEINKGDVVGIIGKNGAGKSTLLKILSRITSPTNGTITMNGRVASLLEVGTGFNAELTGRENIYLNGSILGMTKKEINRKFDEIVAFSGIEKFIDTPVKRYSSGMYVRLAFAVAAHLESEILIVDEVLAVGDAEFQKKCLGKMGDVAKGGRTVLFVSHNMAAVKNLCNKGILIKDGVVEKTGRIHNVISHYEKSYASNNFGFSTDPAKLSENEHIKIEKVYLTKDNGEIKNEISIEDPIELNVVFTNKKPNEKINVSIVMSTIDGVKVFNLTSPSCSLRNRQYISTLILPNNFLNDEIYSFDIYFVQNQATVVLNALDILQFRVVEKKRKGSWFGKHLGVIRPSFNVQLREY